MAGRQWLGGKGSSRTVASRTVWGWAGVSQLGETPAPFGRPHLKTFLPNPGPLELCTSSPFVQRPVSFVSGQGAIVETANVCLSNDKGGEESAQIGHCWGWNMIYFGMCLALFSSFHHFGHCFLIHFWPSRGCLATFGDLAHLWRFIAGFMCSLATGCTPRPPAT